MYAKNSFVWKNHKVFQSFQGRELSDIFYTEVFEANIAPKTPPLNFIVDLPMKVQY